MRPRISVTSSVPRPVSISSPTLSRLRLQPTCATIQATTTAATASRYSSPASVPPTPMITITDENASVRLCHALARSIFDFSRRA